MRSGICNGNRKCVAIGSARSTSTLQELRLCRRYAAHNDCGQVTDINTHFKSRRAGKNICIPRLLFRTAAFEYLLDLLTVSTFQKSGMFLRNNSDHISGAVQLSIVSERSGRGIVHTATALRSSARGIIPHICILRCNGHHGAAIVTDKLFDRCSYKNVLFTQCPNREIGIPRKLDNDAGFLQFIEDDKRDIVKYTFSDKELVRAARKPVCILARGYLVKCAYALSRL